MLFQCNFILLRRQIIWDLSKSEPENILSQDNTTIFSSGDGKKKNPTALIYSTF